MPWTTKDASNDRHIPWVAAPTAHNEMENHIIFDPCHLWSRSYCSAYRSSSVNSPMDWKFFWSRATRAARAKRSVCSARSCVRANSSASATTLSRLWRYFVSPDISRGSVMVPKTARCGITVRAKPCIGPCPACCPPMVSIETHT